MDARRFEAALRLLGQATTRRRGIASALGVVIAGGSLDGAAEKANRRKAPGAPGRQGPCGDGTRAANVCTRNTDCCTGICKTGLKNRDGKGRCRCLRAGAACKAAKNCCAGLTCGDGRCVKPGWTNQTTFGTEGSGDSQFVEPQGVAVSPDELTAWAVDHLLDRVVIWTRPDRTSTAWTYLAQFGSSGSGDSELMNPTAIAVSPDTLTAWISDPRNYRVVVWTRPDANSTAWTYLTQFGPGGGAGAFAYPNGLFVSADTLTVWVADSPNSRIVVWSRPDAASTAWSYLTHFGSDGAGDANLASPTGVFVSPDLLTAWVADTGNNRISIWTRPDTASTAWTPSARFGSEGSGDSNFSTPRGPVLSADTLTIWVADSGNDRVVIWRRPDAASTAWAYREQFGGGGAGAGRFDAPWRLAVSADSKTLWVVDAGNHRISVWVNN